MNQDTLYEAIVQLYNQRQDYIQAMETSHLNNAVETILSLIEDCVQK